MAYKYLIYWYCYYHYLGIFIQLCRVWILKLLELLKTWVLFSLQLKPNTALCLCRISRKLCLLHIVVTLTYHWLFNTVWFSPVSVCYPLVQYFLTFFCVAAHREKSLLRSVKEEGACAPLLQALQATWGPRESIAWHTVTLWQSSLELCTPNVSGR